MNSPRLLPKQILSNLQHEDRIAKWREKGASIGENESIGFGIAPDSEFALLLTIEDGIVISARTVIIIHNSACNDIYELPIKAGRVTTKSGAYIGKNSVILCGATIGRRTIIGAGSVITHDIPGEIVACGAPVVVQGTPDDFRQRFEEAMTQPGPYQYWDFLPWRGRKQALTDEEIKRSKQEFLLKFREELIPLLTNYLRQITP